MSEQHFADEIRALKDYFDRSTRVFTEEHSNYTPVPGTFTVANQVAHTARIIDWFVEGAFGPDGFSMDFQAMDREARAVTSLAEARAWLDRAVANAVAAVSSQTLEEMLLPLPPGPLVGGLPRVAIVGSMTDHTAHHRGALTIYARLLGLKPLMPYRDL